MTTDQELVRRGVRGDRAAFAELFDRHGTAVFRYARRVSADADDAQDLVQETFLTAWRRLTEIRLAGDSLLPWLLVTCRNHAGNLRRSKAVRASVPLDDADGGRDADATLDRLARTEELAWVVQVVEGLDETDRRIVELCLFEGRDYHEAAALLGLSVGALTKRIHRTRSRLRRERGLREKEA